MYDPKDRKFKVGLPSMTKRAWGLMAGVGLIYLTILAAIVWVAIHFISKYW